MYPGYVLPEDASRQGVVEGSMPFPGVICLRCGAMVAATYIHDEWHRTLT